MQDRFGITKLFPTAGREWCSLWDNADPRVVVHPDRDRCDSQFIMRGDGTLSIDGHGIATMHGEKPRMYVYDSLQKWCNVEITFYGMRVSETACNHSQGFVAGARSEHQAATEPNPCPGTVYYGRMLYDGRAHFQKELSHNRYGRNLPSEHPIPWGNGTTMPINTWIGFKYIVRNVANNTKVRLLLYRDLTGGSNGGTWELIAETVDEGQWQVDNIPASCGYAPNLVLTQPATSVFVRNDAISEARYMKFSIREIAPDER